MRSEHMEQVERWANYVKSHKDWKSKPAPFLDSQMLIARRAYNKLSETEEGKRKIKEIQLAKIFKVKKTK